MFYKNVCAYLKKAKNALFVKEYVESIDGTCSTIVDFTYVTEDLRVYTAELNVTEVDECLTIKEGDYSKSTQYNMLNLYKRIDREFTEVTGNRKKSFFKEVLEKNADYILKNFGQDLISRIEKETSQGGF